MAKLERDLSGSFDRLLDYLHDGILSGSSSASWRTAAIIAAAPSGWPSGCMSDTASWGATG